MKNIVHYALDYWYNKENEKTQDKGDDEAKIVQDDSDDVIVVFMVVV